MNRPVASGKVVKAFGNLLYVQFQGSIHQGEVALVSLGESSLKAEVLEIVGDEAKIQVFDDTRGVKLGTSVNFTGELLEAELGPGLLTSIFDGLQNPLEKVAETAGIFLSRGIHLNALDRTKRWSFKPLAKVGDIVSAGDILGYVMEGRFEHKIMVPFSMSGDFKITWLSQEGSHTADTVIARIVNESGVEHRLTMIQRWPVKTPLAFGEKIKATEMMSTGCRVIDTFFPVVRGGTFCSPGPFGAGKTVLQHHLSKYSDVDIVIIVACGERAGEVVEVLRTFPELIDRKYSEPIMNRTTIICNTSSMPVAAREASVYMGITIAEYYRQMGLNVLLLADSTSRWAQAMREMSGRLEEIPGEEAFPAYLASRISSFYERSGVLVTQEGESGSLTIGGTVSPAGGNFEEPVTQATLSIAGAFHGLSRERSDARKYPAIDPMISWSRYVERVGSELESKVEGWSNMVRKAIKMIHKGNEIGKRMEVVGEEGIPMEDMLIYLKAELCDFVYLQQNSFDKEDAYCPIERQLNLFVFLNKVFDLSFNFTTQDAARSFFLELQNDLKNVNFMPYQSEQYHKAMAEIESKLHKAVQV